MPYEKKEGDIAIFYNDPSQQTNPNAPTWTGDALINGKLMRVALWPKSDTMLAGKIEEKQERQQGFKKVEAPAYQPSSPTTPSIDELEDEIPF